MKIKIKLDDYNAGELRGLARNTDQTMIMRAMDRGIDGGSIKTNSMLDMTFTSTGGTKSWKQLIRFYPIYNGQITGEISREDFADILQNADVGVYCDCPSFEYSGAAYHATKEAYNIINEAIRPNPDKKVVLMCKHVYNAITVVNRNMDKITDRYYDILLRQNRIKEPVLVEEIPIEIIPPVVEEEIVDEVGYEQDVPSDNNI